jgi:hypothetical protein
MSIRISAILLLLAAIAHAQQADLFVAPNGNDSWSGKLASPNPGKTDGPLATLTAALVENPRSITLRGGTYPQEQALQITTSNLSIAAYPNETPILSGGVRLTGFTKDDQGRWTVQIPEVKDGKWNFVQLFVNAQRRYRPRLPKGDYYHVADALKPTAANEKKGYDRFKYAGTDIKPDFANLGDVEALCFQQWTIARLRIASVDPAEKIVTFTGHTRGLAGYSGLNKGFRYFLENVKEALSQPGEFYLDRPTGVLTYIPMPGEDMATAVVIAPRIDTLIHIQNAQNLTFKGITFAYGNWTTPAEGNAFPQAEVNLPGFISATGVRNLVLEDCAIRNIGVYAIDLGADCQNCRIERCEMTDMGAGGIKIGTMKVEQDDAHRTGHVIVRDCLMAHGGRLHPAAVGVWIGQSPDNTLSHNDIVDFYYTGISTGWTWGYARGDAKRNDIGYNHIHQLGQGVLSDMGGIYTLGDSTGTLIHHNIFDHIESFSYGGWGIYYDEGTTNIVSENNLVHHVKSAGFHQHYGKDNVVRNNIFAFGKNDQIMRTRPEPHKSFTYESNIVYYSTGNLLGSNWTGTLDNYVMRSNLYWRTDGAPIKFVGKAFEQWQATGQDKDSLIADPMFIDPEHENYALKPGSPAEKIGFKPFDISTAGRTTKEPVQTVPAAFPTHDFKPGENVR